MCSQTQHPPYTELPYLHKHSHIRGHSFMADMRPLSLLTIPEVVSELLLPEPVGVVFQVRPRLHQESDDVDVVDGVQYQCL